MKRRITLALGGALLAVASGLSGGALAAGAATVTVRVEGKSRTLLSRTSVHTHTGWITQGGVAAGKCPASSGQGALDVASHHRWAGSFSNSLGSYFITKILGETDNGPSYYWSIFVNDRLASTGACGIKLHPGDELLFAAAKYPEYPIAIEAPGTARVGKTLNVTVVWFNAAGKRKPLAGATVSIAGRSGATNSRGVVQLTPTHVGTFVLKADHPGYIRAAPVNLRVTP